MKHAEIAQQVDTTTAVDTLQNLIPHFPAQSTVHRALTTAVASIEADIEDCMRGFHWTPIRIALAVTYTAAFITLFLVL